MSRRPRQPRAFTLIELILVMVIIAIISAAAAPSLSNFNRGRRMERATDQVLAVARWARTHAVTEGVVYRLNLDPPAQTFWLTAQQDDGTFASVGQEFGQTFTVPDGITLSCNLAQQGDGQYVEFQPNGRSDPATITLTDADSGQTQDVGSLSATEMFHVFTNDEETSGV